MIDELKKTILHNWIMQDLNSFTENLKKYSESKIVAYDTNIFLQFDNPKYSGYDRIQYHFQNYKTLLGKTNIYIPWEVNNQLLNSEGKEFNGSKLLHSLEQEKIWIIHWKFLSLDEYAKINLIVDFLYKSCLIEKLEKMKQNSREAYSLAVKKYREDKDMLFFLFNAYQYIKFTQKNTTTNIYINYEKNSQINYLLSFFNDIFSFDHNNFETKKRNEHYRWLLEWSNVWKIKYPWTWICLRDFNRISSNFAYDDGNFLWKKSTKSQKRLYTDVIIFFELFELFCFYKTINRTISIVFYLHDDDFQKWICTFIDWIQSRFIENAFYSDLEENTKNMITWRIENMQIKTIS